MTTPQSRAEALAYADRLPDPDRTPDGYPGEMANVWRMKVLAACLREAEKERDMYQARATVFFEDGARIRRDLHALREMVGECGAALKKGYSMRGLGHYDSLRDKLYADDCFEAMLAALHMLPKLSPALSEKGEKSNP